MQSLKPVLGIIGALLPIFCGVLLYHFMGTAGSVEDAEGMGLGPTMIGITVIGALLCIPVALKIMRIVAGQQTNGAGWTGRLSSSLDDETEIDADAVVARHMARRSAEAEVQTETAPSTPATQTTREDRRPAPPAPEQVAAGARPTFGRRVR